MTTTPPEPPAPEPGPDGPPVAEPFDPYAPPPRPTTRWRDRVRGRGKGVDPFAASAPAGTATPDPVPQSPQSLESPQSGAGERDAVPPEPIDPFAPPPADGEKGADPWSAPPTPRPAPESEAAGPCPTAPLPPPYATAPYPPYPAAPYPPAGYPGQPQYPGYPGYPGHPWGAYGWPGRQRTSGQAVASFVLGLVGLFPLGVIFGVLALMRIGRERLRGKGLAVAGIVLSGVWLVVVMGLVIAGATLFNVDVSSTSVTDLTPWTCFDVKTTKIVEVKVVPCAKAHDRQLIARIDVHGSYPGEDAAHQYVENACIKAAYQDFVDPDGVYLADFTYYTPVGSEWGADGLPGLCAVAPQGRSELTGTVRQSASHYTAVQRDFLAMTRNAAILRRQLRDTLPSQWRKQQALASDLITADEEEANALDGSDAFPGPTLRHAVQRLVEDDTQEVGSAALLENVTSEADWSDQVDKMREFDFGRRMTDLNTIRAIIGLPAI